MKKLTAAACLMALPLLAGCNAGDVPTTTTPSSTTPSSPTTEPGTANSAGVKKFGETYTWSDNVSITVKDPAKFTPSKYSAERSEFKDFTALTVTIKNDTSQILDPSRFNYSATSGDKESRAVYDSDNQDGFGGRAKILPGKSLTFKIGYGYTPGQDFNLIVTGYNEKYDKRPEAIYSDKIT